ncbi:tryptophan synthase beta subunit-like PLP-dependent enzyme [Metschnikowia bicuspidata]|uniref:L-serine ammonia-lyase n=1 Tax=Metschnikowia bicuspidata TaxID=27322 RepID=A0A4P9ZEF4_9ASCO|nr:tryptophan synthase beta subunit-like PLP-dependent enzyme [Metschnikowia bicuspidata]
MSSSTGFVFEQSVPRAEQKTKAARSQKPSVTTSLVDMTDVLQTANELPCRVLFKNEYEQPSGSFKLRGIGHLVQTSIVQALSAGKTKMHVYASSGGNAGLAAAYAARFYGVGCTVVVPEIAKPFVIRKLREYAALVILHGQSINDADQHARALMDRHDASVHTIYCHPFDNPLIWQGHAQIMTEVFEQLPELEHAKVKGVVCSVGGGGLYNGLMTGLKSHGSLADCLLVETLQAPTLTAAAKAGTVVRLGAVKSLATSLACSYVSPETLELFQDQSVNKSHLCTIDDIEAVRATVSYHNQFSRCVEPACGAALSMVYNRLDLLKRAMPHLTKDDIFVVVVCGGLCSDEATMEEYRGMLRESRL